MPAMARVPPRPFDPTKKGSMEQHRDEHIVCATCGTSFLFSGAEAAVYVERSLAAPKRCKECRRARKEQRDRPGVGQGLQQGSAGAPRGAGGRRQDQRVAPRYTGDVNEYRSPMPDSYAGAAWSAPSQPRPRGVRPMRNDGNYRAPSFGGERGPVAGHRAALIPAQARTGAAPSSEPRAPRSRPMFSITCKSCGVEGQVPFKPIEGRDVFCQACYRARKSA